MHLKGYLTNLGKYNEGDLIGKWIEFPIDRPELTKALTDIGIDGKEYEEYFITDYDTDFEGLTRYLGEYDTISDLNKLAEAINEIPDYDITLVQALMSAFSPQDIDEIIELIENRDDHHLVEVDSEEDLGYYIIDEIYGSLSELSKDTLELYFDYERFGRDAAINDYTETPYGYVSE